MYWTWYLSGGPHQQRWLAATMEGGQRWESAQREINKNDKKKLTPLPIDPRELYCNVTPVVFAHFVYASFSFSVCKFPVKYKPKNRGEILWNAPYIIYIIDDIYIFLLLMVL